MRFLNFIILLTLFGCKSNKPKVVQNIQHDSIYVTNTITKIKEVKDTLILDNPCDSNGVLKAFDYTIKSDQGSINLKSDGKTIIQKVFIPKIEYKDSIRVQIKKEVITKEIPVKNPINKFLLYSVLILGGILILKRLIP